MYDTNFKNQAVKEYFNGGSLIKTSKKFGISVSALRDWVREYREHMAILMEGTGNTMKHTASSVGFAQKDVGVDNYDQENNENSLTIMPHDEEVVEREIMLKSVSVNIDGHDITISRKDIKKLMEMFHYFEEQRGEKE